MWKFVFPFISLLHGNLSLLISEPHIFNFLTFRQESIKENSEIHRGHQRGSASKSPWWHFDDFFWAKNMPFGINMMTTWLFNISFQTVTFIPCWLHLWLYGLIYPLVQKISDARSPQKDFGCDGNQRAFHLLGLSPSKGRNTGNRFHNSFMCSTKLWFDLREDSFLSLHLLGSNF